MGCTTRTLDISVEGDELQDLGDRIAELAAHIHAATHHLLVLIAEFDERGGWQLEGFRSCAHWLAFRTGVRLGTAREKVRAARALRELPQTAAAMSRGELSFAKVRALTRIGTPDNEGELLEFARSATAAQLEELLRGWRWCENAGDEAGIERARHRTRAFSVVPDLDGMYVVRGRLSPEAGAMLMRAIEAAGDLLFADARRSAADDGTNPEVPSSAQLRADALALLAERCLQVGLCEDDGAGREPGVCRPISRADRYQVVLHVDAAVIPWAANSAVTGGGAKREGAASPPPDIAHNLRPRSHLSDGSRVSAETSRRICCDAGVVRVKVSEGGAPLDVGRRTRTIPPAIRRALDLRDRGCRFPGCGVRFADGHHVRHWADGGATRLSNLLLLCHFHHRLMHEGGYRVVLGRGVVGDPVGTSATFYRPDGRLVPPRPPSAGAPASASALVARNRDRGVTPDWRTASGLWKKTADVERWPLPSGV